MSSATQSRRTSMKLANTTVVVTGGAGFIGSHLVDGLIKAGVKKVIAIDNLFLGKESNLAHAKQFPGFVFHNVDCTDLEALRAIFKQEKIDTVFNLAVIPLPTSLTKPLWTFEENVRMTTNLCTLWEEKLFSRLVHYSSSEVYGTAKYAPITEEHPLHPHTPYAASKSAADDYVRSYHTTFGMPVLIIRPFNNYGPRQNEGNYAGVIPITIKRILRGEEPVIHGDGLQTRDFIYVTDTVKATIALTEHAPFDAEVINLGSGEEITINDLVKVICDSLHYKGQVKHVEPRAGDVRRLLASSEKVKKLIPFGPLTPFDHGMAETIAWYKQ
jgi:UDP-glucose 4-epimerase